MVKDTVSDEMSRLIKQKNERLMILLKEGLEDLTKKIRLNTKRWHLYMLRGINHFDLGNFQQAIEDFSTTTEIKQNKYDKAVYGRGSSYYNRGCAYFELGEYQQAIEDFSEAIKSEPDNSIAYSNRGKAYIKLGDEQHAIEDFNRAVSLGRRP